MEYPHQPVIVNEVIGSLITDPDGIYIDGTVGSGGHSEAIGREISNRGRLLCLDRDSAAIEISGNRLSFLHKRAVLINANFADLDEVLGKLGIEKVIGILLDLGMSSYQLDLSGRGFSFNSNDPLDMRMNPDQEITAEHLINNLSEQDVKRILRDYGEERKAGLISRAIGRERMKNPIKTSLQLATLVRSLFPPSHHPLTKDPATRTFQALRIAVNRELDNLNEFLQKVPSLMEKKGRLIVITYHSLEDRIVKHFMADWERGCTCPPDLPACSCGKKPIFKRLKRKGIRPGAQEIKINPRARSAILRATERI